MWSQAALGHNDFLGEIHIPLANCVLDVAQEYPLLAQKKKNEVGTAGSSSSSEATDARRVVDA